MSSNILQGFRLGPWTVEPLRGAVTGPNGETQHLEPKVMEVFVCLAEHVNEIVTRQQLLDFAWSGSTGSDEQLTRAIGELRRVFHDDPGNPQYIETVPKRGYRLIGEVRLTEDNEPASGVVPSESVTHFPGRKPGFITVTLLALALVYVAFNKTVIDPVQEGARASDKSIAVLPFVNMSDDPGNEYFSDGLSEEIRNLLAKTPLLKVIGRTSSFSYKGKNEDLRVIGQTLGVKTVLEGSVRQSGDQVRVTAQLIDVSDGSYIWSDTYDRRMTNIFELQEDIAAAIIDALQIHVGTNPTRGRPTEVAEAYALFLKARVSLNIQDGPTVESALLQATELDPNFAEAHELLAHLYWTQYIPGIQISEAQKLMRESAARALAIDADLVLARALYRAGNTENYSLPDVIEALSRAARERPNDPAILRTLTWELLITGYLREALRAAERFVEVDPLSSIAHIRHSAALRAVGRDRESIAALKVAVPLTPGSLDWYFGELNLAQNRDVAAIKHIEAYVRQNENTDPAWVEDLVTHGRDPASGQAYLDQRIPAIVQAVLPDKRNNYHNALNRWHLFFGHLDRYFEIILSRIPDDPTWTDVDLYVWYGTLHRDVGFTAHPKYLEVAKMMGYIDVWERRGPPDFCKKIEGHWVCN
jgi:TolB-like protein/DNA-binding winged helix-turn-helix (wHTH) protein